MRARSRLVVGPWHHGNAAPGGLDCPGEGRFGQFQVKLALEWFNAVLSGGEGDGDHVRRPYTPGEQVELEFPLPVTAWRFPAGSRIRVDISSSNYPAFHRHPNTAGPWAREAAPVCAFQTLYLDGRTWIELPLED